MEEFEKLSIGQADTQRVKQILSITDKIAQQATHVKWQLDNLLNEWESVPLKHFFDFVKSAKPELFLYQIFAEMKKISVPGISNEKLISEKLLDIPADTVETLIQERIKLLSLFGQLEKLSYSIRLSEIYNSEDNLFEIDSESFEMKVVEALTIYTQSENENKVLRVVRNLANSINDAVELGLLPADQRALKIDFLISTIFTVDIRSERPILPSTQMFRNVRLKKFTDTTVKRIAATYKKEILLS